MREEEVAGIDGFTTRQTRQQNGEGAHKELNV
jgi:hypothetical protein